MTDVSVLTPSYGYGRFIADAIESVLFQEGVSVQHIVQDGLSRDETVQVLSRFEGRIMWASEPDRGQSDALNKALSKANGRWIGWLNADEFYLPGSLATLVEHGEHVAADIIYGDCVFVDVDGNVERLLPEHRFVPRILRDYGCFISSNAVLIRRSVLGDAPWDPSLKRIMDWDLFMSLLTRGVRFSYLSYPVGAFRAHDDRITAKPPSDSREEDVVASRYGLQGDAHNRWRLSWRGRWLHPVYKVIDGAYVRQLEARSLRGRSLRWFASAAARETSISLMRRCYRRAMMVS
jgi:glycosyltransferase involved in cell wall biosynthesis